MDYGGKMQNIYIMMGLPGAGKTTWAEEKANNDNNIVIISRDDIRYISSHSYNYHESRRHQDFVKKVSLDMLEDAIAFGLDVVIDQLSLTKEQRKKTLDNVRYLADTFMVEVRVHLIYCTENKENVNRRMQSDMRWGDEDYYKKTIEDMKAQLDDEKLNEEGFYRVVLVDKHGQQYREWSQKDDIQLLLDWRTS